MDHALNNIPLSTRERCSHKVLLPRFVPPGAPNPFCAICCEPPENFKRSKLRRSATPEAVEQDRDNSDL